MNQQQPQPSDRRSSGLVVAIPGPGGGDGPQPPPPPEYDIAITSPAATATVGGGEPGAWITVSGTFALSGATLVGVAVNLGGTSVPATVTGTTQGTWTAQVRAYHVGANSVTATLTVNTSVLALISTTATATVTTAFTFAPSSSVPVVTASSTPGPSFPIPEGGCSVTVRATTSDQYGPRALTLVGESATIGLAQASATGYTTTFTLAGVPLGVRQYTVRCVDAAGNVGTAAVPLTVSDNTPPRLVITSPAPGATVLADPLTQAATVRVSGTLADGQSGVASVKWAMSPSGSATTVAVTGGTSGTWSVDVPVTGYGAHTFYVWGTDKANNNTPTGQPQSVTFELISSYVPGSLDERLDSRAYLASLLDFAHAQVSLGTGLGGPTVAQLCTVLGTQLDLLSQPVGDNARLGRIGVNELRVPVELLRAYIRDHTIATGPGAAGESAYLATAYATLLASLGTSYAELRLARGAPAAERAALAARLGLPGRADLLDALLLDGANLTEANLALYFGLPISTPPPTQPNPTLPSPPTGQLAGWQTSAQRLAWAAEDQNPTRPRGFAVLLDPDVVGTSDVLPGAANDPIRAMITSRAGTVAGYAQSLDTARRAAANPTAALAAMTNLALPGVNLAALQANDSAGVDIGAALAAAGLTRPGFTCLRQVARLAAAGSVTDGEWADALAVLVGAHKRTALYPTWRTQETAVVVAPDTFAAATPPAVNPYQVDPSARAEWQALLATRTGQYATLTAALRTAVAAAEQAALPILRDALLSDIAATGPAGTNAGEQMTARYQLDFKAAGTLRTTRLDQAIEGLQSLLLAVRTASLPSGHAAAGWKPAPDQSTFDAAWRWMGDHASWQSAVQAFLFPERHLDPTLLLPRQSPPAPMDTLWATIGGSGPFGATEATAAAATYLTARRAINTTLPALTYLDPARTIAHQSQLASASASLAATDPAAAREVFWAVPLLIAQRLRAAGQYTAALDWYWLVFPYNGVSVPSAYHVLNTEWSTPVTGPDLSFPPNWTTDLNPFDHTAGRVAPFTRYTLLDLARCLLEYGDAEFTRETAESVAHARALYLSAQTVLAHPLLRPVTPANPGEPTVAIPELTTLTGQAQVQLTKLRQGRNIASMPRNQAVPTGATINQPTPYRFKVLLERAGQLTAQAAQIEAGYLAALEKYDAKTLQVFDAQKALDLAGAQVDLQNARAAEAADNVAVATAQQAKARAMVATYQQNLAAPPNSYETALFSDYTALRDAKDNLAVNDIVLGVAQATASAFDAAVQTAGGSVLLGAAVSAATMARGQSNIDVNDAEAQSQADQLSAGIEARRTEWRIQAAAAAQDALVATAQQQVAADSAAVATQEQSIATLQDNQASATLKLLTTQFTNVDLYQWMSRTLGAVYRYFLQQATATARLAQAQLAFERAEAPLTVVQSDYWQPPSPGPDGTDRAGLTGAERLAQDLTQLQQYAFSTDRRRLNLTQTLSLAQLMPVEFLEFRRTGTMRFATGRGLFDAGFPGQYLRLIRGVRVSVVALVPPTQGIRATLYSNGMSRVTAPTAAGFADVVLCHDPALIALTSPVNASGVFDQDVQPDMLLPFEGLGVDTTWELQLPRAANPFDFATISDVLLSVDYTALYDGGYRDQMVARLNADRSRAADCVFSLARDFPDQWYALNNPDPAVGRTTRISLREVDLPLSIDTLATAQVAVHLDGDPVPPTTVTLRRTSPAGAATGGAALTAAGIASTRRGNAAAWTALCGSSPLGDWDLSFGPDADALFASGALSDIQLVVSWTGHAPAWPA